jgi:hypothetical protein
MSLEQFDADGEDTKKLLGADGTTVIGNVGDALKVSVASLPLPAGASTSALQTAANASLVAIDAGIPAALGQTTMAASMPVTLASNQSEIVTKPSAIGPAVGAFGGLRVSQTFTIGAFTFANSPNSLLFSSLLTTGGTVTHVPASAAIRLRTTTASGSRAIYQGRRYYRYSPGDSHRFTIAAPIGAAKTNVTKRVGLFDALDGLFLEQTGTEVAFVVRSSTSGSAVDTRVIQANWNVDKFDGTGPSGITINLAFHNIFFVDYSWHGAGRARFGFFVNGQILYAHNSQGGNTQALPWTRTPLFPFRFEITNTGTTASATNLDVVACHFSKESSDPIFVSNAFSSSSLRANTTGTSTLKPLLSIRAKLLFSGITNRIPAFPTYAQVQTSSPLLCQVLLNPTLTGGSWVSADGASTVEFNRDATALTGGSIITEFYIDKDSNERVLLDHVREQLVLGLNIVGDTADIVTLAIISTSGNTKTYGTISWQEYQ